jgi:hypothetical protein
MHAESQAVAIRARVDERGKLKGMGRAQLDEALATCAACKEKISFAAERRKNMGDWAYE